MAESREIGALRTQMRRLEERIGELERQLEEHRNFEPDTSVADFIESTEHFVFAILLGDLERLVPGFSIDAFRTKVAHLQTKVNAAMPRSTEDERRFGDFLAARGNDVIAELIPPAG